MDLDYHTLPWLTLQFVRIPAYNNKLVQGWKNMCNLRFCSQLLVPIIMHFYFFFMQKTKTCRLIWPNFTTFLPISKPSIINQANKTTFYNTKCQTKARRDFNQKQKVTLCCKCLGSFAFLWFKMPMFWRAGMTEGGKPLPLAFQYLIFIV